MKIAPPAAPFRTEFVYSNYFYTLAGYVAEKLTNRTWEDLVRDDLLTPLSMTNSGFVDQVNRFDDFAQGYIYVRGTPSKLDGQVLQ